MVKHCKSCFNCSDWNLTTFGYWDFWFKNRSEMFLCYADLGDKNLLEELLLGQFFVSGYLLLITQIGGLCSWCNNNMYKGTCSGMVFLMLIIWFYLKFIWEIKILPDLPRYLRSFFTLQKLLRLRSYWRNV